MASMLIPITAANQHLAVPPKSHQKTGYIKRDFAACPPGYLAHAPVFPSSALIPAAEQQDRLDDQVANKSSLFDFRTDNYDVLKSLDQNGYGLCWAFSSTKASMYLRSIMNEPAVRMSAYWVAGRVKGWRDEGGWGASSTSEIASEGVPPADACPAYSSKYDTDAVKALAAPHKVTAWWDGTDSRDQNEQIMISAFLMGLAPVLDYDWWSHSVCGCRLVSLSPITIDIDNSWGESAGDKGIFRLQGSHAIPDSIVVPRVVKASA